MATTMQTHTRMVITYDNWFIDSKIANIFLANVTAATGSSVNHLRYEDPSLTLRTNAPTANPEIIIDCTGNAWSSGSNGHTYVVLANQNVWRNYDLAIVFFGPTPGGAWTELGRVDLAASPAALVTELGNNPDFVMLLNGSGSGPCFRIQFTKASAWPAIEIGGIYLMRGYQVPQNPTVDAFVMQHERDFNQREAVGGALHVTRGHFVHRRTTHRYQFTRIDDAMTQRLLDIHKIYGDRLCGIIPPNQAARVLPIGTPHLLGRIPRLEIAPRQGITSTTHRNDVQMQFAHGWSS